MKVLPVAIFTLFAASCGTSGSSNKDAPVVPESPSTESGFIAPTPLPQPVYPAPYSPPKAPSAPTTPATPSAPVAETPSSPELSPANPPAQPAAEEPVVNAPAPEAPGPVLPSEPETPVAPVVEPLEETPTVDVPVVEAPSVGAPALPATTVLSFKKEVRGRWLGECIPKDGTSELTVMSFSEIERNKVLAIKTSYTNPSCREDAGASEVTTSYLVSRMILDNERQGFVVIEMATADKTEKRLMSVSVGESGVTTIENGATALYPSGPY